jgi:hypothetical protein
MGTALQMSAHHIMIVLEIKLSQTLMQGSRGRDLNPEPLATKFKHFTIVLPPEAHSDPRIQT